MSREFKFRCWNEHGKCFHGMDELSGKFHLFSNKNPSYVIEQYTGLKDINGVEIYEGLIVKGKLRKGGVLARYIGEVKFSSVYQSFVVAGAKQYFGNKIYLHELYMPEIIGNIHQNPEMI